MQLTVGANSLETLLAPTSKVSVPAFQRNFSWTKIEVSQFLSDIYSSAATSDGHFWGPVVVLQKDPSKLNFELIDGQQRITTAVIMLAVLRDQALQLTQKFVNLGLPSQYELTPGIRNSLFLSPRFSEPRFVGSYLINTVLSERIIADPTRPNPSGGENIQRQPIRKRGGGLSDADRKHTKELRAAYLQIEESLKTKISAQPTDNEKTLFVESIFHALTRNFEIHTMVLISEDDAYTLFESLNDRGLRLNPGDLLKTFTLDEIRQGSAETIDGAIARWDDAMTSLGDFDFTKFLRHFLLTRTTAKVGNRKIFSEFKNQVQRLQPGGAVKNLGHIEIAASNYSKLLAPSLHPDQKLRDSFNRMSLYSQTHRVFLLGMLELELELQDQQRLTRAIENLSYRWIATGGNAQELETIYQQQLHMLKANPITTNCMSIVNNLLAKAPLDEKFIKFTDNDSPALQKYLLIRIEKSRGGDMAENAEIEHLAPQQPGSNGNHWYSAVASPDVPDEAGNVYEDYVYNWGNLTLLERSLNRTIRNSEWPVKLTGAGPRRWGINDSNYSLNQTIKTHAKWTAAEIISREDWIKSVAMVLLSENWVKTGLDRVPMWS